jgi:hypothetical protein
MGAGGEAGGVCEPGELATVTWTGADSDALPHTSCLAYICIYIYIYIYICIYIYAHTGEAGELATVTRTGADSDATIDLSQSTCFTSTKVVQILTRGGLFFFYRAGGEAGELATLTWTGVDSDATVDLSRVYLLKLPQLEDVDAAGEHARIGLHAAGAEKHE